MYHLIYYAQMSYSSVSQLSSNFGKTKYAFIRTNNVPEMTVMNGCTNHYKIMLLVRVNAIREI